MQRNFESNTWGFESDGVTMNANNDWEIQQNIALGILQAQQDNARAQEHELNAQALAEEWAWTIFRSSLLVIPQVSEQVNMDAWIQRFMQIPRPLFKKQRENAILSAAENANSEIIEAGLIPDWVLAHDGGSFVFAWAQCILIDVQLNSSG
jgi:hypothetical protein